MDTRLTRRSLIGAAGLTGAATLLPAQSALAAPGWRLMPEKVVPPLDTGDHRLAASARAGMVTVAGSPIPRTVMKDGRTVIHPTQLGNLLNAHMASYQRHPDRAQLTFVAQVAEALMQRAPRRQGARFLAYEFAWHVDGQPLTSPWFSAFGQSKFPMVLSRLARATGERRWSLYCHDVLAAFRMPPAPSMPALPWIAGVDANNCLWLEEYPRPGGHFSTVFNGHFYAMSELAAYERESHDPLAADLVQGAAGTLDFYRNLCRRPGHSSAYYANSSARVPSYHAINTSCYTNLFDYTGATRIGTTVDQMVNDWPISSGSDKVRLAPRPLQVMHVVNGVPSAPAPWRPPRAMLVDSSSRQRWEDHAGTWLLMRSGPQTNRYVREVPDLAYRVGFNTDRVAFRRSRVVTLNAGAPVTGWRWSADGVPTAVRTLALPATTTAHSNVRANLGGRQHILISDGALKGLWVRETSQVHYR